MLTATGEAYAVAALVGCVVVVVADVLDSYIAVTASVAVASIVVLRPVAIRRNWSAPLPRNGT